MSVSPKLCSPAQCTRARKRHPYNIVLQKINRDSILQEETGICYRHRCPLNGPMQQFIFSHSPRVLVNRGQSGLELCKEKLGFVALRRKLKGQDSCAELLSHTADATFLGLNTPLHTASAWGSAIAPPSVLPIIPISKAYALLRSQLPGPGCRGLNRLRLCQ